MSQIKRKTCWGFDFSEGLDKEVVHKKGRRGGVEETKEATRGGNKSEGRREG